MNQKQLIVPVKGGCSSEGYLEMVNSLLRLALGAIYTAKDVVTSGDLKLLAFLREETDRAEYDFSCGVELSVIAQRPSEVDQTLIVSPCHQAVQNFPQLPQLVVSLLRRSPLPNLH